MARQVLPMLDLRAPEQKMGLSSSQRNIQAITGILQVLGQAEQVRRERDTLDRITRAIGEGKTNAEAIKAVIEASQQQPRLGTGIPGILQRIGGAFQPSPGGGIGQSIQQSIVGQRLQQMLSQQTEPEPFTLGPGQVRFAGSGTPVAGVPAKPPTKTNLQAQEIMKLQEKQRAGTLTKPEEAKLDKLLIGQPLVEIGLGKPASAAERTAIAEARSSIDDLYNLKALFKEEFVGPVAGRIAPPAGLVGGTTKQQEDFMAATSAFKNMIIKQITGAQMSESEAKRIMKQIPDITDPPVRWKAKWEQSLKNIERIKKHRLQILEQSGLRAPYDLGVQENQPLETPQQSSEFSEIDKRIAELEAKASQ